jgi:group I intron endonuclease
MLVYLITNKKNGKKYVGQHAGKDLESYWRRNVWLAETGYQGKRLLYRAIRKYGADGFDVAPLVIVGTKQEMDYYEIGLIKAWDTTNPEKGYNITHGGDGSLGVKMSQETRDKMSESRTGLKMPESHSLKLSERNKGNKYALGRKMTKENFEKLLATHVGAKRSDEARKRMSEAHLGKKPSEETKQKMRLAQHNNRHVKVGFINPKCLLCREGSNSNVIPQ